LQARYLPCFAIYRLTGPHGRLDTSCPPPIRGSVLHKGIAKPGQTYAYKIVAINKLGNSGYSNVANVKTPMDNSLLAKIISLI
jgi:hypothetical protein